jgi:hypothetical protein
VASTILYFIAKKRQWQVRASIHRVTQALKSPLTPRFPRQKGIPEQQSTTRKNKKASSEQNREPFNPSGKGGNHRVDAKMDAKSKMDIDPEKGFGQQIIDGDTPKKKASNRLQLPKGNWGSIFSFRRD